MRTKSLVWWKVIFFVCLSQFTFSFTAYAEHAEGDTLAFPQSFATSADAKANHCTIVHLKGKDNVNCVLEKLDMHVLLLGIYDEESSGIFKKSMQLCIPSWHGMATVNFVDLLGDARKFIEVTFEGNEGTGTLQIIKMYIGWNKGAFVPVLAETISYHIHALEHRRELSAGTKLRNASTPDVTLDLNYRYTEEVHDYIPGTEWKTISEWSESLRWNKDAFSFYDPEYEKSRNWEVSEFRPHWIRRKITHARLSLPGLHLSDSCKQFFDWLPVIMDVIVEDKHKASTP